jgi:hypothetical protein
LIISLQQGTETTPKEQQSLTRQTTSQMRTITYDETALWNMRNHLMELRLLSLSDDSDRTRTKMTDQVIQSLGLFNYAYLFPCSSI